MAGPPTGAAFVLAKALMDPVGHSTDNADVRSSTSPAQSGNLRSDLLSPWRWALVGDENPLVGGAGRSYFRLREHAQRTGTRRIRRRVGSLDYGSVRATEVNALAA